MSKIGRKMDVDGLKNLEKLKDKGKDNTKTKIIPKRISKAEQNPAAGGAPVFGVF